MYANIKNGLQRKAKMLQDPQHLIKIITTFIKAQLSTFNKQGIVIYLDGTLMSVVNLLLVKHHLIDVPYTIVACKFSDNLTHNQRITSLIKDLNLVCEVKDLQHEFNQFDPFNQSSFELQTALKKRISDLAVSFESDKTNSIVLGNLCYSQWCINFPHSNYKNLNYIYPLNSLFYSEVQQLAYVLQIPHTYIHAAPTHFLFLNQLDQDSLGFSYEDLENLLRQKTTTSAKDQLIQSRLFSEDRHNYLGPSIYRPSNILN